MNNLTKENDRINELQLLKKWAWINFNIIDDAKKYITQYERYSLLQEKDNFLFYIAKIVIYSLFYEVKISYELLGQPDKWINLENCSDYYSISNENIIFNSGLKDFNDCPYYIIFSKNDKQPWKLEGITTCTNHFDECKCITTLFTEKEQNFQFSGSKIDYDHIFKNNRLPEKLQERDDRRARLSDIIKKAIENNFKNAKKTIRFDGSKIVQNYFLPLDFEEFGGYNFDLYACIKIIDGPKKSYQIPTIMTFEMVYSQLLEKPEIDHWTYACCKSKEQKLKEKIEKLEHELKNLRTES